ncbi:MAG: porin [Planctomycetia bacterium]|nr:porin [Planctomycetia bacterium]
MQFDFAGGTAVLKDAYIGIKGLPVGYLKIGHFNEPFSMNLLISSKYITFMERASPTDGVFAPGRNTGVQLSNTCFGERATWAIGVFRDTGSTGMDTTDGGHAVTGRVTALPIYRDKGRKLLHVGLAGSYRDTNKTTTYAARPEMHLAPKFMSTGSLSPSSVSLLGGEVAAVYGPWSAQAEVIWSSASGVGSSGNFYGYYGQLSYFLTGEHRPYKKSTGLFSRVKPKKNFGKDGGRGAWEVAGRYSFLDLSDAGIAGGQLRDFTLGLNWYLNPNTRIMWNYVHAELLGIGYADLAGMRVQIDF